MAEDFYFLFANVLFQTTDQFFSLPENMDANDFDPTKLFFMIYCIFEKHFVFFWLKNE
jgi:hypothetical protein